MADKSINQLPVSDGLTDDGLLVVYQNSETKSITGKLIKQFAEQGIESALEDAKASGEFDGKDGVSATHSWNGTTLTVTSASGTSSANLRGDDGYTPVKGTDYWTDADKAEMVEDVIAALPDASEVSY